MKAVSAKVANDSLCVTEIYIRQRYEQFVIDIFLDGNTSPGTAPGRSIYKRAARGKKLTLDRRCPEN